MCLLHGNSDYLGGWESRPCCLCSLSDSASLSHDRVIGFSSSLTGTKTLPSHPRGCLHCAVRNNRAVEVQSKCPSCSIWRVTASLNTSRSTPLFHMKILIFPLIPIRHWLLFHWPCKNEPLRRPYLLPRQSHDCVPQMKVSWGTIRNLKAGGIQEVKMWWLYNYMYLHKSWAVGCVLPRPLQIKDKPIAVNKVIIIFGQANLGFWHLAGADRSTDPPLRGLTRRHNHHHVGHLNKDRMCFK